MLQFSGLSLGTFYVRFQVRSWATTIFLFVCVFIWLYVFAT